MLNGVEQSYITERTFNFLSTCRTISIIPVTTRTIQQYERVKGVVELLNCEYVLVLNGAVLIKNGIVDNLWLKESRELVKKATKEMNRATELLKNDKNVSLKYHDTFLTYASTSSPEMIAMRLNDAVDQSLVYSFYDNRKVYCTPTILTKGNAVRRMASRLKPDLSFAVGDSENDLSMLECVDIPIVPYALGANVANAKKVIVPQSQILSDATCDVIERALRLCDK